MYRINILIIAIMSVFLVPAAIHAAAVDEEKDPVNQEYSINMRANYHTDYLRIVMEGPDPLISQGKIVRVSKGINVVFPADRLYIRDKNLPFKYDLENNIILLSLRKVRKFKYFALKNPSRLVIDVYQKRVGKKKDIKSLIEAKEVIEKKIEKDKSVSSAGTDWKKTAEKKMPVKKKKALVEVPLKKDDEAAEVRTVMTEQEEVKEKYPFIIDEYKSVAVFLESGKSFAVLKELETYTPADSESIAMHNFLGGEANRRLGKYKNAIDQLRKAYIYSSNDELKEMALMKRAWSYHKLGLLQEAAAYYILFINNYPSSLNIERANLDLADIFFEQGDYVKAIDHYGVAGQGPAALFGLANALHKIEMIEDAGIVYQDAMATDSTYPEKHSEVYYFMGENSRLAGDLDKAEEYLSMIEYGPYKPKADMILGLIYLERDNRDEASVRFSNALKSKEMDVRANAIYNLSLINHKEGRLDQAISGLEDIRHKYINSSIYRDAVFELAKIFREQGKFPEAISHLKALIFSKNTPEGALKEVELILDEMIIRTAKGEKEKKEFVKLWSQLGEWLFDRSREEFLLRASKNLRHEGAPFLNVAYWLTENGSRKIRVSAATALADYYIGMRDIKTAKHYLNTARQTVTIIDDVLRVEVKTYLAEQKPEKAYERIRLLKKHDKDDLRLLGSVLSELEKEKSKKSADAVRLYVNVLEKQEWPAEDYVRLADILYAKGQKTTALKYYRTAYTKNPDIEWAGYRVGRGMGMPESEEMYVSLQKGSTVINQLAKSKLLEITLLDKVQEVY